MQSPTAPNIATWQSCLRKDLKSVRDGCLEKNESTKEVDRVLELLATEDKETMVTELKRAKLGLFARSIEDGWYEELAAMQNEDQENV